MNRTSKVLLFGTGVASVAALIFSSACSSKRVDLVSGGRQALDQTERLGREAMTSHTDAVDAGLDRFRKLFDDYRPEIVSDLARTVYADDVYFNDGFVEIVRGSELAEYFERSAGHTAEIEVLIEEITRMDDGVYLRWVMTFTTNGGTTVVAPGISHLRFNAEGRIIYHHDYWDAGSALAELVPLAGPILRSVKTRL